MATKNKTTATGVDVMDFINSYVDNEQKRTDSFELIKLMRKWSGFDPYMWGPTIIGFDQVHYVYPTGREGDMPLAAFSPRKQSLVIYLGPAIENTALLGKLGKHKTGVGCLYVNKLDDVDRKILRQLVMHSVRGMRRRHRASRK